MVGSPSGGVGSTCGLPPALTELSIWEDFNNRQEGKMCR